MSDAIRFASPADLIDAGTFVARVGRLDAGGVVRLRSTGQRVALWAWLPIDVLVTRTVAGGPVAEAGRDVSVVAAELLTTLAAARDGGDLVVPLPGRRDGAWRGSLPAGRAVTPLDLVPADVVRRLVVAAEAAFRAAAGAPEEAAEHLLAHQSLEVSGAGTRVAVPLRILLGLARMGFLGDEPVRVGVGGPWLQVAASFGAAYRRRDDLPTSLRIG